MQSIQKEKHHRTKHLRLFAANPTRKPNAAANSADAPVLGNQKKPKQ
jgi:hypothetical protein